MSLRVKLKEAKDLKRCMSCGRLLKYFSASQFEGPYKLCEECYLHDDPILLGEFVTVRTSLTLKHRIFQHQGIQLFSKEGQRLVAARVSHHLDPEILRLKKSKNYVSDHNKVVFWEIPYTSMERIADSNATHTYLLTDSKYV